MNRTYRASLASLPAMLMVLLIAACGGGGAGPPPVAAGIGPAGGTVTAANGASVTVPAGALAAAVSIGIAVDSSGAPALPPGTRTVGAIHAMTPHGTTFAQPVTLAIAFDPTQVLAGETVGLLKTNAARSGWEPVAGASVSGSMVSAPISSFSNAVAVAQAAPAANLAGNWTSLYNCDTANGGFSGEETLILTQNGATVGITVSDGARGTGAVAGDTVIWNTAGPGYTETGTWTILSASRMTKDSTYTNTDGSGGGRCRGSIHKNQ